MVENPNLNLTPLQKKTSKVALASIVLVIIAFFSFYIPMIGFYIYYFDISYRAPWYFIAGIVSIIPFITSIGGLVLGIISLIKINKDIYLKGTPIAVIGIIFGLFGIITTLPILLMQLCRQSELL
jgi:hypothetical protein